MEGHVAPPGSPVRPVLFARLGTRLLILIAARLKVVCLVAKSIALFADDRDLAGCIITVRTNGQW